MKTPQGYRNVVKEKVNPNRSWKTYPNVFHKCDWYNDTQLVLVVKRYSKEIALCNINRADVYMGTDVCMYWTVGRVGDFKATALTRLLKMTKETMQSNEMESRATQVAEVAKTLEMWKSDDIYMQRRK